MRASGDEWFHFLPLLSEHVGQTVCHMRQTNEAAYPRDGKLDWGQPNLLQRIHDLSESAVRTNCQRFGVLSAIVVLQSHFETLTLRTDMNQLYTGDTCAGWLGERALLVSFTGMCARHRPYPVMTSVLKLKSPACPVGSKWLWSHFSLSNSLFGTNIHTHTWRYCTPTESESKTSYVHWLNDNSYLNSLVLSSQIPAMIEPPTPATTSVSPISPASSSRFCNPKYPFHQNGCRWFAQDTARWEGNLTQTLTECSTCKVRRDCTDMKMDVDLGFCPFCMFWWQTRTVLGYYTWNILGWCETTPSWTIWEHESVNRRTAPEVCSLTGK